jgi:hypothetical protein
MCLCVYVCVCVSACLLTLLSATRGRVCTLLFTLAVVLESLGLDLEQLLCVAPLHRTVPDRGGLMHVALFC